MKKKSIDLKTLWERASKTRKVCSGSTSTLQPVTIESQAQNQSPPSIEVEPVEIASNVIAREPKEIASNDPDIASTTAPVTEHGQPSVSVPSTWSPIRDGDDSDYESSDESMYDIDLLSHDPGKKIPIKRYDVNEWNYVIRGYIALGPCQPWGHNFPIRKIGGPALVIPS